MKRVKPDPKADAPVEVGKFLMLAMPLILEPELPMREVMGDAEMLELIDSLNVLGQLQPILTVRRDTHYEIVDGHRRWFAAQQLHWTHLAAKVYESKGLALEAAKVHSNLIREEVNAAQEAVYYTQLVERHKLDEARLCALVRRSPDYIAERLRLLRGDEQVFEALRTGAITFGVARALNRSKDEAMRRSYLDQAIRSGTSARVVEQWVAEANRWQAPTAAVASAAALPGEPPAVPPYHRCCALCGGDKDQFNLAEITVHKWEWEMLHQLVQTAGEKNLTLAQVRDGLKDVPE